METRERSGGLNYHRQETRATSKLRASFPAKGARRSSRESYARKINARPRKSSSVNYQPAGLCRLTIFPANYYINPCRRSIGYSHARPFERQS